MAGAKHDLRLWYITIFLWFLGVIFESVLCSPHDIHRIVLKTHRRNRERNIHKNHSNVRPTKRPTTYDTYEEDTPSSIPIKNFNRHYSSYRKNENERGKSSTAIVSTIKPPTTTEIINGTIESLEVTIPIRDDIYNNHFHVTNNSIEIYATSESKHYPQREKDVVNSDKKKSEVKRDKDIKEEVKREKQTSGYEVYEEIIGDVIPPPPPRLILNKQKVSVTNAPEPIETIKREDINIKENATEYSNQRNKTNGTRNKTRRNRGNVKFDEVILD